ncbi:MAG: RIP metalloprotease RseP, partial [Proteobacteria bacterium]|nr:RIP metalloprotease RseP [Pseudomonadota bacterium]
MLDVLLQNSLVVILFTLGVLILIHELGHYLVGVWFRMGVASFSIGFGPAICSFKRHHTVFKVGLIPLGGYVQFVGATSHEQVPEVFKGKELYKKPLWQRSLMVLAGPVANFLLAAFAFSIIAFAGTPYRQPIVGVVEKNSPADMAGMLPGDQILRMASEPIKKWSEISQITSGNYGKTIEVLVARGDQEVTLLVTTDPENGRMGIIYGFIPSYIHVSPNSPAFEIGLRAGDHIVGVAIGASRESVSYDQWQSYLSGEAQNVFSQGSAITQWHELMRFFDGQDKSGLLYHHDKSIYLITHSTVSNSPPNTQVTQQVWRVAKLRQLLDAASPEQFLTDMGVRSSALMITQTPTAAEEVSQKEAVPAGDSTTAQQLGFGDYITHV